MIKISILGALLLMIISGCATTKPQLDMTTSLRDAEQAYQNKDWPLAEKKYTRLISDLPGDAELWFRLGNIYAHSHQASKAIAAYKEAVIRKPRMAKAWHNMGIMSLRATTHLYIEMLQYIPADDPLFQQAKNTGDQLLDLMQHNNKGNNEAGEVEKMETVIPPKKSPNHPEAKPSDEK